MTLCRPSFSGFVAKTLGSAEETLILVQRVMTLALGVEARQALPLRDGTSLDLEPSSFRKVICDQALEFMAEMTLEEELVPAAVMFERLSFYLYEDAHSDLLDNWQAVTFVSFVCIGYERAASDFEARFPEDNELLIEVALAAEAVTSFLRWLNNGKLPRLNGSAVPCLARMVEQLRDLERERLAGPPALKTGLAAHWVKRTPTFLMWRTFDLGSSCLSGLRRQP